MKWRASPWSDVSRRHPYKSKQEKESCPILPLMEMHLSVFRVCLPSFPDSIEKGETEKRRSKKDATSEKMKGSNERRDFDIENQRKKRKESSLGTDRTRCDDVQLMRIMKSADCEVWERLSVEGSWATNTDRKGNKGRIDWNRRRESP